MSSTLSASPNSLAVAPGRKRHVLGLTGMVLATCLAYVPTLGSYYCGYDDFNESHRAVFEDIPRPARIFTTSHFHTSKYRPLNRLLTAVSWAVDGGNPIVPRVRNLIFHILGAGIIYGIGLELSGSAGAAFAGSLFFGLHPLANQTVVLSVCTNSFAYAMMFGALLLFMRSVRSEAPGIGQLLAALGLEALAIFAYEPTLIFFVLAPMFLVCRRFSAEHRPLPRRWIVAGIAGAAIVCAAFFGVRQQFAEGATGASAPDALAANVLLYSAALIVPIDPLLANSAFGFPLPSEIMADSGLLWLIVLIGLGGAGSVILFVGVNLLIRHSSSVRLMKPDWRILFLIGAAVSTFLPFAVFTEHLSETYVYPGAAFASLLLAFLGQRLLRRRSAVAATAALALLFGTATILRNERVRSCGATALRVLAQLPVAAMKQGVWNLLAAPSPDDAIPPRYGIYSYAGIGAIDPGGAGSLTSALQLATGNTLITGTVVDPDRMPFLCRDGRRRCYWVRNDGTVEDFHRSQ